MPPDDALVEVARDARNRAYAPYSHYPVGAAVEMDDDAIYAGCNVENSAYPQSICAERVAIVKAVSEGHRRLRRIAVATADGGMPCGGCRSVMAEFGTEETEVLVADADSTVRRFTLAELLPEAFELQARPE